MRRTLRTLLPLALLVAAIGLLAVGASAENIDPLNVGDQYAYGENAGWINAEPANCANCGMQVNDTNVTGYMWGENIGWVNLNCSNDASCAGAAGNWGVSNDNAGNLKGYAWSENAGWINFSCQNNGTCGSTGNYGVHISPTTGAFSGRAWSENQGWITFASAGPVAYQVKTSWTQTIFQVNTNDDVDNGSCNATHCSLREAINATNATSGANTITFNISGAGVHTITPASALPTISDPVTIDATTQPGYATSPLIELNGTSAGSGVNGLTISTTGTTVVGFAINRFNGSAIVITGAGSSGNVVQKDFLGTNAAGTAALGNGQYGVLVGVSAHDNTIGGSTGAARNVISGDLGGVYFLDTAGVGNLVKNNYIGTDSAGSAAIANTFDGVTVQASVTTTIDSNLLSGNSRFGVYLLSPSANVTVNGNTIGLSATNTPLGNGSAGILAINSTSNQITNNTIAGNSGQGIIINTAANGNKISGNSIFNNTGLGIDLDDNGITVNDSGDGDTGGNNHQNFPVLSSAATSGGSTKVTGTLNSTANTAFTIEFFSDPTCDGSGNGEGQVFLGSLSPVTTDGSGNASFAKTGLPAVTVGQVVTTTATRNSAPLDTSEFSACRTVTTADADSDGVPDSSDNCPNWPNPSQNLPAWTVPAGDSDCDGFPDAVPIGAPNALNSETNVGTDPTSHCAATATRNDEPLDAWPPDVDDSQAVNGNDLLMFAPVFGKILGNPGYDARYDLSNDNKVNGSDLLKVAPFFGKHCV